VSRAAPSWRALLFGAAAAVSLLLAAAIAGQWVDDGDATCTALYRVDEMEYWFTRGCRSTMIARLGATIALLVAAGVFARTAVRARRTTSDH
jgi:hypothetical protein